MISYDKDPRGIKRVSPNFHSDAYTVYFPVQSKTEDDAKKGFLPTVNFQILSLYFPEIFFDLLPGLN